MSSLYITLVKIEDCFILSSLKRLEKYRVSEKERQTDRKTERRRRKKREKDL